MYKSLTAVAKNYLLCQVQKIAAWHLVMKLWIDDFVNVRMDMVQSIFKLLKSSMLKLKFSIR